MYSIPPNELRLRLIPFALGKFCVLATALGTLTGAPLPHAPAGIQTGYVVVIVVTLLSLGLFLAAVQRKGVAWLMTPWGSRARWLVLLIGLSGIAYIIRVFGFEATPRCARCDQGPESSLYWITALLLVASACPWFLVGPPRATP